MGWGLQQTVPTALSPSLLPASPTLLSFPEEAMVVFEGLKVGAGSNIEKPQSVPTANLEENQWLLMRFDFSP